VTTPPIIRFAAAGDAAQMQAIYAPFVLGTPVSFELVPPDVEEMRARIVKTLATHPWVVMEREGAVAGYAYASRHRERAGYQWSTDVSCYTHPDFRRQGIGRALYLALIRLLRAQGFMNAYAGIALPNDASVGLHESVGFVPVGTYGGVGFKLGRWHDVGWWGLRLQDLPEQPAAPTPLARLGELGLRVLHEP
jgi:L-amino acid N-acyltransferase YncA